MTAAVSRTEGKVWDLPALSPREYFGQYKKAAA